jgi:hypothetical protein
MSRSKPDTNFRIASALGSLFGPDAAGRDRWLDTPNPDFDGLTPHELAERDAKTLAEYLEDRVLGNLE